MTDTRDDASRWSKVEHQLCSAVDSTSRLTDIDDTSYIASGPVFTHYSPPYLHDTAPIMTINTAKAHTDSSRPHVPKPITLEEACEADTQRRNVENVQSQAPASDVSEATPSTL